MPDAAEIRELARILGVDLSKLSDDGVYAEYLGTGLKQVRLVQLGTDERKDMPYTTPPADRTELKARLLEHADMVINALIEGLAAAGSETEWDSETIENVLGPIERVTRGELGIPAVGFGGENEVNTKFWCEVGGYEYEEPWDGTY